MEITEVRIFPRESEDRKLKAYATITIDNAFVVRNVKVIEGNKGLFVAMPSRKLKESCAKCGFKNSMRSKFCNQCGSSLPQSDRQNMPSDNTKRRSGHRDIAHPITSECREYIQAKVLDAYANEIKSGGSSSEPDTSESREEAPKDGLKPEASAPAEPIQQDSGTDEDFEGDLKF